MAAEKSLFDLEAYRQEEDEAVRAAARASTWWEEEWLKFPSVSKQPDGSWRYWCVPADSGVYQDDWPLGERLARETVAQMRRFPERSEEHPSELQSIMRISYAVFCLKKQKMTRQNLKNSMTIPNLTALMLVRKQYRTRLIAMTIQ